MARYMHIGLFSTHENPNTLTVQFHTWCEEIVCISNVTFVCFIQLVIESSKNHTHGKEELCPTETIYIILLYQLSIQSKQVIKTYFIPRHNLVPLPKATKKCSRGLPLLALGSPSHRSGSKRCESGNIVSS